MNCFKNGKLTNDSCFGCEIKSTECELSELVKAKQDGRLAVLPCKVGTRVWFEDNGKIDNGVVKWFDTGHPDYPRWTVAVQDVPRGPRFLPLESIKLTREEAEAALKEVRNETDEHC